ncbi:hypothetical protein TorRG33x02_083220 [Trema orientale]|uniref:Uncharacterized protein n=1 Tax=Trema orientale TaxID=63057 RepID=A0A2P5FDE0_TREOI|nr:hypothetical protein TorRG33x02_083220 [Trema orientale]
MLLFSIMLICLLHLLSSSLHSHGNYTFQSLESCHTVLALMEIFVKFNELLAK